VPQCAGRVGVFSILAQGQSCCTTTAITPTDKRVRQKKRSLLVEIHREISTAAAAGSRL